ncbi:hypothetical protein MN608_06064 [Microdochium nivale]|nr:hypothetical protein MN608_06064 [Microdochium nivale]
MKVSLTALAIALLQASDPPTVSAIPLSRPAPLARSPFSISPGVLEARADDWTRCVARPEGRCSLFIATGDSAPMEGTYRNVVLYSNRCEPLDFVTTTVDNGKVVLKGDLSYYVDVHMNREISPDGMVNYREGAWSIDEGGLGNMDCHRFEGVNGLACRMDFECY